MIEGSHEVPCEVSTLWSRCQEVRQGKHSTGQSSPASRKHNVYPLTGILRCDNCNEPYHGVIDRQKGKGYRRMSHSFRSCHIRPLSLPAHRIEDEFAERVLPYLTLDDGWQTAVLQALSQEGPRPDRSIELKRVESALANLRKQHLWGAISDEEFKKEFQALDSQRKTLASSPTRDATPDLERAVELLRNLPKLWHHPGVALEQRQDLAREVFEELRLRQGTLVAVRPRPTYAPLFAYSLWKNHVVGGDRST
ncbi:MAG: zinc ribbon domain-containing protein [Dehalococcoidia bacterium]